MISNFRIIPKIEVKRFNLVKGIKLEGIRVLGNPMAFIKEYEKNLADEILIEDVTASLLDYIIEPKLINEVVSNTSTSLSVGGGINSLKNADLVFAAGADRVVLCSEIVKNLCLIAKIKDKYGSQSVGAKLEIYAPNDKIEYFTYLNGREIFHRDPNDFIEKILDQGIGEIHANFIDRDGTGKGINLKVLEYLRNKITIPLIYSGGVSTINDINILQNMGADGVAIASSFHYGLLDRNIHNTKEKKMFFVRKNNIHDIGNQEWLVNGYGRDNSSNINFLDLKLLKKILTSGRS